MISIRTLAVLAVIALAAAAGFVYSGAYDVAADDPHWPVTHELLGTLKERSIAARIGAIEVPTDLDAADRVRRGAGNYDAMCVSCHLRPGVHDSEIRKGLYPQPPNLAAAAAAPAHAARQFWVIKHGIKMSAMPAWSLSGVDDDTIWDMVAFLQKLPGMTAADYQALVKASEGHTHAGADDGHKHAH